MPAVLVEDESLRTQSYKQHPFKVYVVLIVVSVMYFGKYFCTSNMYVVQTLFQEDQNINDQQMSTLFALGFAASVVGKIVAGIASDKMGGRPVLMVSAIGYVTLTFAFAWGPQHYGYYLFIWFLNGFFALGLTWVAVVAVASNWIPASHTGRLMALVNLAPQIGDALARAVLSPIAESTGSWSQVFTVAGCATAVMTIPAVLFAPDHPHIDSKRVSITQILHEGAHEEGKDVKDVAQPQPPFMDRLKVLLKKPLLYIVALLSGSLYGIRVLFLLYSTTYLATTYCNSYHAEMDNSVCRGKTETIGSVGTASMIFTGLGCVSVLVVGQVIDKIPGQHKGGLIFVFLVPLIATLVSMTIKGTDMPYTMSAMLVGVIGFCLFGPYKNLGTTFANKIGGKDLKATACAVMGVSDNTFAILMLMYKGTLGSDWVFPMFRVLTCLSVLSTACAAACWANEISEAKKKARSASRPLLA